MKQKSAVTEKQVRDLAAEGLAQNEIAKQLGCAQGTVAYFVKTYNIEVVDGRSSKNHAAKKVYSGVEADNLRIKEVVQAAGITPPPVQTSRMTPIQALDAKLKWPWVGKVQQLTPSDLNPNFYDQLLVYHPFAPDEIAWMFGFKSLEAFGVWLKKWGYPQQDTAPSAVTEKSGIETNRSPSSKDVEEFFAQDTATKEGIDKQPIAPDDIWESVPSPIRPQETPLLSICKTGCFLTKAARELLADVTEVECQVRQDGQMIRIGRGGNIRLNKSRDTIYSDQLKNMIEQKNIALPARYLLAKQGNWIVGERQIARK